MCIRDRYMGVEANTQSFFDKHVDDITAIDVHPDGVTVVTGELGPKPTIYVWSSETMMPLHVLKGGVIKGIATVAFSLSGARIAAACIDDNHTIAVFDLRVGALEGTERGDTAIISELRWKDDRDFVTVGPKHFKAWTAENKAFRSKRGVFGNANNLLVTAAFNNEDCLVGASNGELQIWMGANMTKALPIHTAGIDALYVDVNYILTGGKDSKVNFLDRTNYAVLLSVSIAESVKLSRCPKVRSVCLARDGKTMLVGTFGSEIFEVSTKDAKITKTTKFATPRDIIRGHYTPNAKWTNEVWGLAIFNDGKRFATCSDDGTLRIWSVQNKRLLEVFDLNTDKDGNPLEPDKKTGDLVDSAKGRSLSISPDDGTIAVGCKDGTVRIVNARTLEHVTIFKNRGAWISEVKYSPSGDLLAVGSHEAFIDVYLVPSYKKKFSVKKHSSYITHIDWSENSANLQSNCGAYELLFWDVSTGQQLPGGATMLRDERWATWTCVLGWPVQGIWPPNADGTDINSVDRSKNPHPGGYYVLAAGDDSSRVRLLRYPSLKKGSEATVGRGHSSHVTTVRWGTDDQTLFSTGGEDNCVFQWKVAASK
eukprot:TRINITY_DN6328_c0_g1_i1.p1 TRINITY_DN6328_c0_g1~~TRINITY_DN6328_c0_g1_i1.p1  ORF type:complete len:614 (+),score=151.97 TRINITY_DN6328_c0_g1_i1:60-1844(+)